jgi:hypothetical protein
MPNYRPSIQEYIRVSEALLKVDELSDEEKQAVQDMSGRLSEMLLTRPDPTP